MFYYRLTPKDLSLAFPHSPPQPLLPSATGDVLLLTMQKLSAVSRQETALAAGEGSKLEAVGRHSSLDTSHVVDHVKKVATVSEDIAEDWDKLAVAGAH